MLGCGSNFARGCRSPSNRRYEMKSILFLVLLWIAIAIEAAWIVAKVVRHAHLLALAYPLAITVGFLVLAVTRGRRWWITSPLRMLVGIAFVSAVCDRLG